MKLFIVKFQEKFHIAVSAGSERIYFLDEMGFHFDSIEEFIKNTSTTEQENLKQLLNSNQIFKYPAHDKHEIIFHSPVIRPMQDIICLGMNYFKTLNETETTDFEDTVYFSKRVNYAVGDGETILAHSDIAKQLDYEAELLVILGKDAYQISEKDAENYIFGYSIINDITARDLQKKHKQWYLGKSLDGFTAIGPCIVTADEIENAQNLDICCTVNGELRQKSNTSFMIKSISAAIAELSAGMTLSAGTMIATGTPYGAGKDFISPAYLKQGDIVSCQIQNIGTLTNKIN